MTNEWNLLSNTKPPMDFVQSLNKEWMLVTAGTPESLGTMTISWGGHGFIWNKNVVCMVIRESRNTLKYLTEQDTFSLTLFPDEWHDQLFWCGRNSGRDVDKLAHCGLTAKYEAETNTPYFEQAHTAFICRKIVDTILEQDSFHVPGIWETWYNEGAHKGDKHHLIIGSIEKIYTKSDL